MCDVILAALERREELLRQIEKINSLIEFNETFAKDVQPKASADSIDLLADQNIIHLKPIKEASLREATRRCYRPTKADEMDDGRTVVQRMQDRAAQLAKSQIRLSLFRGAFSDQQVVEAAVA